MVGQLQAQQAYNPQCCLHQHQHQHLCCHILLLKSWLYMQTMAMEAHRIFKYSSNSNTSSNNNMHRGNVSAPAAAPTTTCNAAIHSIMFSMLSCCQLLSVVITVVIVLGSLSRSPLQIIACCDCSTFSLDCMHLFLVFHAHAFYPVPCWSSARILLHSDFTSLCRYIRLPRFFSFSFLTSKPMYDMTRSPCTI